MYADREEVEATRSVKERLNGSTAVDSSRRRTVTGKRQRQDDKWEHDLFDDETQNSNRNVGARDLRLKLQKKGLQSGPGSGVRDLRERLSGVTSTPSSAKPEVQRAKQASQTPKPARRSGAVEASVPATKSIAKPAQRKKNQKDAMESFLDSLGLEKYLITFQAEEVDMAALKHMTDEDLKAMGIPMGPRKKILLALDSRE